VLQPLEESALIVFKTVADAAKAKNAELVRCPTARISFHTVRSMSRCINWPTHSLMYARTPCDDDIRQSRMKPCTATVIH